MRSSVLGVLVLCVVSCASRANAECPQSAFLFPGCAGFYTAAPAETYSCLGICGTWGGYDIPAGTLYIDEGGGLGSCYGVVTVEDDFVVSGATPGAPIALSAQLAIETSIVSGKTGASAGGGLRVGANGVGWGTSTGGESSTVLALAVSAIVGTPFHLVMNVWGSSAESAGSAHGIFSFAELPSGVTVTSCRGFAQGAVAARTSTWGLIKALYR